MGFNLPAGDPFGVDGKISQVNQLLFNTGTIGASTFNGSPLLIPLTANTNARVTYGTTPGTFQPVGFNDLPRKIGLISDDLLFDYVNETFPESASLNQRVTWRFSIKLENISGSGSARLAIIAVNPNPLSSLNREVASAMVPQGAATNDLTIEFALWADSVSLPAPLGSGVGYQYFLLCDRDADATVNSIVRYLDSRSDG